MAEHSFIQSSFPVLITPYTQIDRSTIERVGKNAAETTQAEQESPESSTHETAPFMEALLDHDVDPDLPANKMRTENGDVTFAESGNPLVDLFYELEDRCRGKDLENSLNQAWQEDPDLTLKIIWNARSIHLGKSNRSMFYRAIGWLAKYHPRTLLDNLHWLVRPVIQKKVPKTEQPTEEATDTAELVQKIEVDEDSDFEIVDADEGAETPAAKRVKIDDPLSKHDVKYGVAHGYWKDLLNILALASNDALSVDGDFKMTFKTIRDTKRRTRDWTPDRKKSRIQQRYEKVKGKLADDSFYKALHMQVAKLFADQLAIDAERLQSGTKAELKRISMAAKWAPSNKGMHDEHTFIVSTIAELLHPVSSLDYDGTDRELFLRHARSAYQSKTLSPLRKHLDIVERHITAKSYAEIKYDRLPSLAMKAYTKVFKEKDTERFTQYVHDVAQGKARISGAVLLPSTMVTDALRKIGSFCYSNALPESAYDEVDAMIADGQWNTLVQRVKDSGSMESSIAVCDVSGSMSSPQFQDHSTPMHAAIGLSLLLAEVCKPPFGGAFITFHERPEVIQLEDEVLEQDRKQTFYEKVHRIQSSPWGGSTNFQAVFLDLILPMAKKHNLRQEDMVKRVFVFSDMHFDQAGSYDSKWSSSFERIKKAYNEAGYEMPELVFWNLASGARSSRGGTAPMPVDAAEPGTALVNGYSQAMMKVFMDGGGFDELNQEDVFEKGAVTLDAEGNEVTAERPRMSPLGIVKKAVTHEAYSMLKVVD